MSGEAPAAATTAEKKFVQIGDFTTEAGALIRDVTVAYHSWGEFTGDNLVLVEHALTGDSNAGEWWPDIVGPDKAIDTNRWFVLCTNVIGGCQGTTGPSSPHPDGGFWGSRFPGISIRDQVAVEKQALDALGIKRIAAVIGGSMGGARALEWSIMHPKMVDSAVVMAVSARASAWQIGIQAVQINAIEADPAWQSGDYYGGPQPVTGLSTARKLAHLTYRGELEIDERFGTDAQAGENPMSAYRDTSQRFAVESYLDYQAEKLVQRFDAGSYVILTDSLNRHDVGRGRGGLNKALASSNVPTMIVGVDTDILYPYHQQEHLSRNIGNLLAMAKISSPVGHDAFLTESRQVDRIIRRFFDLRERGTDL